MDSPLAYIGGKSKLSESIIEMIPDHKTYCEVFAGGLWVFFRKDPSMYEVINDLDCDLIAFYRVIQNHLEEFLKQFKYLLVSREQWKDWKDQLETRGLTDIQKAARYYYVQRLSYAGKVKGRSFGTTPESRPRINLLRMEEELSEVHLRFSQVMIENLSWEKVVEKYDKPATFFYLDPPYYSDPCYKHNFEFGDYVRMNEVLQGIAGKFILSINDHPKIRDAFSGFNIKPVELLYTVGDKCSEGKELIISNYEIKAKQQTLF
ncbi:MAG: adenine methyltransferase [Spirochaetae bacterium HGW-Spirochaetae-1]|nr:MAG: adenine methyltransferase [Spirochaetae bacterium HGW-Spirochaetae-1]